MKIVYQKGYDPGEDSDFEWTEEKEVEIFTVQELIDKLQKFIEKHPNASIQRDCELELVAFDENNNEYNDMLFVSN